MHKLVLFLGCLLVLLGRTAVGNAAPLAIDGSVTTNTCPGGAKRDGGRACEYGGTHTFDTIELRNGAVIYVATFDNAAANKPTKGNLVLRSTSSIYIDRTSRITAKGAGYQAQVCDNGPGPNATAGGRGGCAVMDSGGGGAHYGRGGKGTKDCFIYPGGANDVTCTFPNEWEEACGTKTASNTCSSIATDPATGLTCYGSSTPANGQGNAQPDVAGQPYSHHILDVEFGAAGGDKGCRDGYDVDLRAGDGGGRIVLFAANDARTGTVNVEGRIYADGYRGCSSGNDSAGGGAGGTILIVGDSVTVGANARVSAAGGRGGDSQPKALSCASNADCGSGQTCRTFTEPGSGNTYKRCDPANCTPARTAPATPACDTGYVARNLQGFLGTVCIPTSRDPNNYPTCSTNSNCNSSSECVSLGALGGRCVPKNQPICDYLDTGETEDECKGTQNSGTCDDCAGGGGGGVINVMSRTANINPQAIFDVRGGKGGICPICAGEAGAGAGELQIDAAYVGEICDGKDNDFDGSVDEGLGSLSCPDGTSIPACTSGTPNTCPTVAGCNAPVTDTRPRFSVIVDTSGSMLLDEGGVPRFGDGSVEYPGVNGQMSRLFNAKGALTDVMAAFPEVDYSLARYYQDVGPGRSCQTASWFECAQSCCSYDDPTDNVTPQYPYYYPDGQCVLSKTYPTLSSLNSNINIGWSNGLDCINYAGSCGPPERGAQYLVDFGQPLSSHLMWLDNKETNFQSSLGCTGGDCELRGTGPTPLASSLQATYDFLEPHIACDKAVPCREYSVILLTDGAESCRGNPVTEAQKLNAGIIKNINGTNTPIKVKTYVIAFSTLPAEQSQLNAIAAAGGTNTAYFVNTREELANALATIISRSFKFETCNGLDDDCDSLIDEDFPEVGNGCNDAGKGLCRGTGEYACKTDGSGTQCVIDSTGATPKTEVCNSLDDNCNGFVDEGLSCQGCVPLKEICDGADNDCDNQIDEPNGLVDTNLPCGLDVGLCELGRTVCVAGNLECQGATGPQAEACDGLDNDCDDLIDGMTQACYTGPAGTLGVGVCVGGIQLCTAVPASGTPRWGTCSGQIVPTAERCDGVDNDCNGTVDDNVPAPDGSETGDACCPAGVPCGTGPCSAGTWKCAGTTVVCDGATRPSSEVCDGVDNDCNGPVDDIPGVGSSCVTAGGCPGALTCDAGTRTLRCVPSGATAEEICNGLDDDCDGFTDEAEDLAANDERLNKPCDEPTPPRDKAPCKAGTTVCVSGSIACEGAVRPGDELCDLQDNDCDGVADQPDPCPGENACIAGLCAERCGNDEFPCPGSFKCNIDRYCVPTGCEGINCPDGSVCDEGRCVIGTGGSGGSSGAAGSGGTAGEPSAGGASGSAGTSSGASGAAGSAVTPVPPDEGGRYGLATGGGGIRCDINAGRSRSGAPWALVVIGIALLRRARASRRQS